MCVGRGSLNNNTGRCSSRMQNAQQIMVFVGHTERGWICGCGWLQDGHSDGEGGDGLRIVGRTEEAEKAREGCCRYYCWIARMTSLRTQLWVLTLVEERRRRGILGEWTHIPLQAGYSQWEGSCRRGVVAHERLRDFGWNVGGRKMWGKFWCTARDGEGERKEIWKGWRRPNLALFFRRSELTLAHDHPRLHLTFLEFPNSLSTKHTHIVQTEKFHSADLGVGFCRRGWGLRGNRRREKKNGRKKIKTTRRRMKKKADGCGLWMAKWSARDLQVLVPTLEADQLHSMWQAAVGGELWLWRSLGLWLFSRS